MCSSRGVLVRRSLAQPPCEDGDNDAIFDDGAYRGQFCPVDERQPRLRLDGRPVPGRWSTLSHRNEASKRESDIAWVSGRGNSLPPPLERMARQLGKPGRIVAPVGVYHGYEFTLSETMCQVVSGWSRRIGGGACLGRRERLNGGEGRNARWAARRAESAPLEAWREPWVRELLPAAGVDRPLSDAIW